jgi:hypothetical protein
MEKKRRRIEKNRHEKKWIGLDRIRIGKARSGLGEKRR